MVFLEMGITGKAVWRFCRTRDTEDAIRNEFESHSQFPGNRTRCSIGKCNESTLERDSVRKGWPRRRKLVQIGQDEDNKIISSHRAAGLRRKA